MAELLSAFVKPPVRLRAMSDRSARWLRFLWVLLFGLSVLTVVVSTLYAVRASYAIQPVVTSFGLDFEVSSDGELTVGTWSPLG